MRGPAVIQWEHTLKQVFDRLDHELEDLYDGHLPLHPVRAPRGATANPEADGLFNIGASYSAGFGSRLGPGYVVDIRLSTLERIPDSLRAEVRNYVSGRLRELLPEAFPGKDLQVSEENNVLKIHGDLSL